MLIIFIIISCKSQEIVKTSASIESRQIPIQIIENSHENETQSGDGSGFVELEFIPPKIKVKFSPN